MQLFRSEADVASWCSHYRVARGETFSPRVLWELARRWYDDRLDPNWTRRSIEERQRILDEVGLRGPFWSLRGPG